MILVIIIILLLLFILMKPENVYQRGHSFGVKYLNNTNILPGHAVMFDIDDTLLFTKNDKPIKPIIELVRECNKRGILVLIITARDSIYTLGTVEDLLKLHIFPDPDNRQFRMFYNHFGIRSFPKDAVFYDFLYLRHSPEDDHEYFKSDVKKRLAETGIITIMSVGDNEIDVRGNYSGYALKLPNTNDPRLFHKNPQGKFVAV